MSCSHPQHNALVFSSPDSLSKWLKPRLPPGAMASWGSSPGSKTVNNLWIELSHGETSLSIPSSSYNRPFETADEVESEEQTMIPIRSVHVARLKIRNRRGDVLVESHQLLSNGSVRPRGRPLSEKMRPGETMENAALRAVKEELAIANPKFVKIVPDSYAVNTEEKASASYPGLPARYVLHSIEAQVDGLPEEGEFSTEEMGDCEEHSSFGSAVFVKKHFWKWIADYDSSEEDFGVPLQVEDKAISDGTLSADDFYIAGKAFCEQWKRSNISTTLPDWTWTPCKRAHTLSEDGYLSLENVYHMKLSKGIENSLDFLEEQPSDKATVVQVSCNDIHAYDFHIIYSFSYRVPVLYFQGHQSDGQLLGLDDIQKELPEYSLKLISESKWTFITLEEHPYLHLPWYMLHPCGTNEWMRLLLGGDHLRGKPSIFNYLISWLSVAGQAVGLMIPISLINA